MPDKPHEREPLHSKSYRQAAKMYRIAVLRSGETGPPYDVAQAYVDGDKADGIYYIRRIDPESGDPFMDLKTAEEMHIGGTDGEPEPPQAA